MEKEFQNKTILVTGGSSGIGEAIAKRFLDEGAHVVVFDINPSTLPVTYIDVDVADEESVKAGFKNIETLDMLVNNAGTYVQGPIEKLRGDDIDRIFNVNLKSVMLMSKHAMPLLKKSEGQIINIASMLADFPRAHNFLYPITKAGVVALTQALAQDYPKTHVRVNAISPGPIRNTNIHPDMDWSSQERIDEEIQKRHVPMGRHGTPEEVASLVAYVASEAGNYIHGANLVIDGGRSIAN